MSNRLSRRNLILAGTASLGVTAGLAHHAPFSHAASCSPETEQGSLFGYCLNTGTIRGQKLTLPEQIDVTAEAGYQAIEPWIGDIQRYADSGGSLSDVRKRLADRGLTVASAIGFADWISDDDAKRQAGLEQMKRDMDLVAQIGGKRIAAPPSGGYRNPSMDLRTIAERYRKILELGRASGVVPQLELWGGSMTLSRLSEVSYVAVECGDPDAGLLLDVYHLYKGGSGFAGLRLLNGAAMHVFHINDYPADPPREQITDAHRVYPGDGVAPLEEIVRMLRDTGFRGVFSLELFNRDYWQQDALAVARTGLAKMRAVVAKTCDR